MFASEPTKSLFKKNNNNKKLNPIGAKPPIFIDPGKLWPPPGKKIK